LGLLHRKTKHTLYRTIIERETISAMTTVFAFKIASYFVMGLMLMTLVVNRESLWRAAWASSVHWSAHKIVAK